MQLSSLLTDDSRSPIEKLRRHDLQVIARRNKITFNPSGPATDLRKLIEGSGIDVVKETDFQRIQVEDESGMVKEIVEPVVKEHATANKDINYDAIIEANAKANEKAEENTELKKELDEVKAMLAKLMPEKSLEERYIEKFGKKPHHRMKPETIKAELDAKL